MTTNEYDARLARLRAATEGDRVTVPDGWTRPDTAPEDDGLEGVRPGDAFTHDGDEDAAWQIDGGSRDDVTTYATSENLAALGLDVDAPCMCPVCEYPDDGMTAGARVYAGPAGAALPADGSVPVGFTPLGWISGDGLALDQGKSDADKGDDEPPVCCGCGLCARLCGGCETCAPEVLDSDQRARVAALEEAVRVLESRRGPSGGSPGVMQAFAGKSADVPMVGTRPLIDVAAFIADGDTARSEVEA